MRDVLEQDKSGVGRRALRLHNHRRNLFSEAEHSVVVHFAGSLCGVMTNDSRAVFRADTQTG